MTRPTNMERRVDITVPQLQEPIEFPIISTRQGKEWALVLHFIATDKNEAEDFAEGVAELLDESNYGMDDQIGIVSGTFCFGHTLALNRAVCPDLMKFEEKLKEEAEELTVEVSE